MIKTASILPAVRLYGWFRQATHQQMRNDLLEEEELALLKPKIAVLLKMLPGSCIC